MPYEIKNQEDNMVGVVFSEEVTIVGSISSSKNILGRIVISETSTPSVPSNYGLITWNGIYLTVS